ncbi:MAG: tellurite resistance TerB family protein [Pseudomonadota bacterium]
MALFSRLRGGSSAPDTTIARAVLAPAVLTMAADGSIDQSETTQLANMCMFSPIFAPLGGDGVSKLIADILTDLQKRGADAVITEAVQTLSPALRETSFCFAMRVAMADGVMDEGEKNALSGTASRMELPQEVFQQIITVVGMMQRPATA